MKYTKEFKEEALKLSDEIGVRKTAEQLGLKYNTARKKKPVPVPARTNRHGESVNWNRNSPK